MDQKVKITLDNFFNQFKIQSYKKGEILIRADDEPQGIYFIKEGLIKKYAISQKGEEITVNIFKPYAFFPMSWAMNDTPNTFFYEASINSKVVRTPKDVVIKFIKSEPDVLYDLMKRVYLGTDGMLLRMMYLMSGSAYTRLITELLIHTKRFGIKNLQNNAISVDISEKDLASQVGMTRETVSREIKILKDRKLVTFGAGKLTIPNLTLLEEQLSYPFNN